MKFDNLEYRKTLGKFVTGVTIITTCEKDGTPRGFTANSFTSVSLEPPLILICIGDFNEGLELFKNSEYFAVNILNEAQVDISNLFAQPVKNKFEEIKWSNSKFGVPIIKEALAWLECKNFDQIRSGDHLILIGNVKNFHNEGGYPLAYYNGNYISFNNETSLVNAMEKDSKTIIGAIIEKNNSIMFKNFEDTNLGIWSAHGEGKFILPGEETDYNIIGKYSKNSFPSNPNGSDFNTAILANKDGRHIAMMPHLERSLFPWNWGFYPKNKSSHTISPWIQAFKNAYEWLKSN